jgi:hypothetical protein
MTAPTPTPAPAPPAPSSPQNASQTDGTTLTFWMSPAFVQEVTGVANGQGSAPVWAYLWNEQPPSGTAVSPVFGDGQPHANPGATNNTTPLIINGQLLINTADPTQPTSTSPVGLDATSGYYYVEVPLTNASTPYVSSGSLFFLLQSAPVAEYTDLPSSIGNNIGQITPNSSAWNFGYSQFEYTLSGAGADTGDLTGISGFSRNTAVRIEYTHGSPDSRGFALSGAQMTEQLIGLYPTATATEANVLYPVSTSPLGSTTPPETALFVSPSNTSIAGLSPYSTTVWDTYLATFATLTDVRIHGAFQGAPDALGIYHNPSYYDYLLRTVELPNNTGPNGWGPADTYFVFVPSEASQTKGYIVLSETVLESNLYAAGQGNATVWQDPYLTQPYLIPGSGAAPGLPATTNAFNVSANNQWGNVLTQLFTGFTGGYWGAVAEQSNPLNRDTTNNLAGGPINLNDSINQSPTYAFDGYRTNTIPTTVHNDAYSQLFLNNANAYGSAFSDNLAVGLTPGPLISLGEPNSIAGQTQANNVSNIDLFVYGSNETSGFYRTPIGANYLPVPHGQDYLIPTVAAVPVTVAPPGLPGGLQIQVDGSEGATSLRADVNAQLGIYKGNGQFEYVSLGANGNIWQTFTVTGAPGSWTSSGTAGTPGTFFVNLPMPATVAAGEVYWYQLVLTNPSGGQKVFDFYAEAAATASAGSLSFKLPPVNGSSQTAAVDGGATVTTAAFNNVNVLPLDLNVATSLPPSLLTNSYYTALSTLPGSPQAAPVAGMVSAGVFTAWPDQNGTGLNASVNPPGAVPQTPAPTLTLTGTDALNPVAFGWTGTNLASHGGVPTLSPQPPAQTSPTNTFGLISDWTNKMVPGHVAQINVSATAGPTFSAVLQTPVDLDGQWYTETGLLLGNGTYEATVTEMLADGVTQYSTGPSVQLTITVTGVAPPGAVTDTAANVSADLDTYGANLPTSITISDSEALTVKVSQITGDAGALAMTQNADTSAYKLIVQDRAANVAAALSALSANTHVQEIEFTDVGESVLQIAYTDYTVNGAAIDKMTGAHSFLMSVTGQAYSSMSYDYNDDNELTGAQYFHTGITGQAYTGYEADYDGSNRLLSYTFTGVSGQAYHAYEYDYAAGYASVLPNNGLIGRKYFFANVQGQPYTNYEHDLNETGLTTRLFYSGITSQLYSSYEDDYIINSTGSHFAGQKYYFTDIVGRNYTGHMQQLDSGGNLIQDLFTGGQVTSTQLYSSWTNDYANGVLTGQTYYQTDIIGQNYTGYVVELNATGQKIGETFTGVTGQAYSAYEYEYANGDGVVTGITHYFTNVQNTEYASYQLDYAVSGATSTEAQVIYNMNDGSHTIKGLLSTAQTLNSIFDDVMTGGSGADNFDYAPLFGTSVITDFNAGEGDTITLPTSEFANWAYVNDPAHSRVVDGNTVITGSNGDSVTLLGITTLQESDFLFA